MSGMLGHAPKTEEFFVHILLMLLMASRKKKSDLKILLVSTSSIPLCPDGDDQKPVFYCPQCAVPVCFYGSIGG